MQKISFGILLSKLYLHYIFYCVQNQYAFCLIFHVFYVHNDMFCGILNKIQKKYTGQYWIHFLEAADGDGAVVSAFFNGTNGYPVAAAAAHIHLYPVPGPAAQHGLPLPGTPC